MIILRWGKKTNQQDYEEMEYRLESVFLPQSPRPEFVADLQQRLLSEIHNPTLNPSLDPSRLVIIAAGSFLGGTLMLVLGIRSVLTILAGLGVIHQLNVSETTSIKKRLA